MVDQSPANLESGKVPVTAIMAIEFTGTLPKFAKSAARMEQGTKQIIAALEREANLYGIKVNIAIAPNWVIDHRFNVDPFTLEVTPEQESLIQ